MKRILSPRPKYRQVGLEPISGCGCSDSTDTCHSGNPKGQFGGHGIGHVSQGDVIVLYDAYNVGFCKSD